MLIVYKHFNFFYKDPGDDHHEAGNRSSILEGIFSGEDFFVL